MGGDRVEPRRVLDSLTALRMFAALAVFDFHIAPLFSHSSARSFVGHVAWGGPTGVSFFFMLSGFVLTWSRRGGDRRRDFYRRRFARIYPLHLLTWAGAGLLLLGLGFHVSGAGAALSAVLVQSWAPQHGLHTAMDTPSWSLSCEAFFYAVFPFLLPRLLRLRSGGRRGLMVGLVAVSLVLTAIGPAVNHMLGPSAFGYFPEFCPPARLPEFVLGILLALEVEDGGWPRIPVRYAAVAAVASFLVTSAIPSARLRIVVTLVPYLLLIGATAQAELAGTRGVRRLTRPWPVRLGQWSFAFYLVHGLAYFGLIRAEGYRPLGTVGAVAWALLILAVSLAVSAGAYYAVERPLERRLRGRAPSPAHLAVPQQPVAAPGEPPPAGEAPAAGAVVTQARP